MKRRSWGPAVCLDCAIVYPAYCETCTRARKATGKPTDREAYNAYHRDYQERLRKDPVKGPGIRQGSRERGKRYRDRKKKKENDQNNT